MSNDQVSKLTEIESTTLKLLGIGVTVAAVTFTGTVLLLRVLWGDTVEGFVEGAFALFAAVAALMSFSSILGNAKETHKNDVRGR